MPEATVKRGRRRLLFGLVVLACVAVAAASIAGSAARGPGPTARPRTVRPRPRACPLAAPWSTAASTRAPGRYGRLAWATAPGRRPTFAAPACERVYYAAGRGICLSRAGALGASVKVRILGERPHAGVTSSSCPACRAARGCRPTAASVPSRHS